MRVALNSEGERIAGSPLRVKTALRPRRERGFAGLAIVELIETFSVGRQVVEHRLHGHAGKESERVGLARVLTGGRAVFEVAFQRLFRQCAHGNRPVADPAQHERQQGELGQVCRERVIRTRPFPSAALATAFAGPLLLRERSRSDEGQSGRERADELPSTNRHAHVRCLATYSW